MTLFAIQQHSWTALELIRQTLMRSVQSIERSLHLIYKNLFSIKQYQFPPQNWPEFIQRVTPYFATECSSTAGAIHLPYTARSHGGVRQGVEGVSLSVRPTRTKLDYDHGNTTLVPEVFLDFSLRKRSRASREAATRSCESNEEREKNLWLPWSRISLSCRRQGQDLTLGR